MLPLLDRVPNRRVPMVNYGLIAANVLSFMWERRMLSRGLSPDAIVRHFGVTPAMLAHDPIAHAPTVVWSMFLHDPSSWYHIAGNLLFLWVFGDAVESALGRARYLGLYLACGGLAALAQVAVDTTSWIPMVGASGAIAGVLAAYGSIYPRAPITVLNPWLPLWFVLGVFLDIPAWLIIGEYFVVNLWSGLASAGTQSGGPAFFAHLGGFVAGILIIRVALPRKRAGGSRAGGFANVEEQA